MRAEDTGEADVLLGQLGFTFRGRHRSKDARLWTEGPARVVCNEQHARDRAPTLAAVGFEVADPAASAARARALQAPPVFRRTLASEQELPAFRAPDGTEVFLGSVARGDAAWVPEFEGGHDPEAAAADRGRPRQPGRAVAVLRRGRALLQQRPRAHARPRPGGPGSLAAWSAARSCAPPRVAAGWRSTSPRWPGTASSGFPQHVAFATDDVVTVARRAVERGLVPLAIPRNYYEDLLARFDLPAVEVETMAELGLLYDRDATGDFTHFYTATVGNVFFEVVQRRGGYDGYGAPNAGVRLAAQHRLYA